MTQTTICTGEHDSCDGCRYDLGGECCAQNLEAECGKDGYQAWESDGTDKIKLRWFR